VTPAAEQPGASFTPRLARGGFDDALAAGSATLADWLAAARRRQRLCRAALHLSLEPHRPGGAACFRDVGEGSLPAAGCPGHDAVRARQPDHELPDAPVPAGAARTTLRVLAARQAENDDAFSDEEPGKIMHEIRFGEQTVFGERPHSPYYGSADATPLFLVLLDEYHRWSGDDALARQLEPNARAALRWIDEFGDATATATSSTSGARQLGPRQPELEGQLNSMLFHDGTLATTPIAPSEVQAMSTTPSDGCASCARVWADAELASTLEHDAERLRERFRRDFWLPERGHYALALDRAKRPLDSLTSNIVSCCGRDRRRRARRADRRQPAR